MRGHIRKRGKSSWQVIIPKGRDASGKYRYDRYTVQGTKKDAEAKLAELLHQLNTGTYVAPSRVTVAEFLERWLADAVTNSVKPSTLKRNAAIVRQHLIPALGNLPLTKLSALHVQAYYNQALASGRLDDDGNSTDEPLSAATIRRHHAVLHKALGQAVKWGLLARNVADLVEPPRVSRKVGRTLDAEQVGRLLDAARDTGRRALYLTAVATGLRQGELLALRWQDVDFQQRAITVRRTLVSVGNQAKGIRPRFAEPKTDAGVRRVTMPAGLAEELQRLSVTQELERVQAGPEYEDYGLVFCTDTGRPISPRNLVRQFKSLLQKAGLPNVRFHDLRHTHASLLLELGVHDKVVSERLGHASIDITINTYAHVMPGLQEQAAAAFDTLLKRIEGQPS